MFCQKRCSLEVWKNSQENTVNFAKFLRTPFLQNTSGLLLQYLLVIDLFRIKILIEYSPVTDILYVYRFRDNLLL